LTQLLPHAVGHPADICDRDRGVLLLSAPFGAYPFHREAGLHRFFVLNPPLVT
jgi:hypothetical protein